MCPLMLSYTDLNSAKAFGTQEAFTLLSNVSPTPFKQVDDGSPSILKLGVVLGKAKPEQSHQDEQLHAFDRWENQKQSHSAAVFSKYLYSLFPLLNQWENGIYHWVWKPNRCIFITLSCFCKTSKKGENPWGKLRKANIRYIISNHPPIFFHLSKSGSEEVLEPVEWGAEYVTNMSQVCHRQTNINDHIHIWSF